MKCDKCGYDWGDSGDSAHACGFYQTLKPSTHPPQRTWVGLTDKEIDQGLCRTNYAMQTAGAWRDGVDWAEAKLKEKNF